MGLSTTPGRAEEPDPHAHHHHPSKPAPASVSDVTLADQSLLTQDGKGVGFRNDVVGGKIAMIHFIFTTGATVCPTQSVTFSKLQTVLGDRFVERSGNLSACLCTRTLNICCR